MEPCVGVLQGLLGAGRAQELCALSCPCPSPGRDGGLSLGSPLCLQHSLALQGSPWLVLLVSRALLELGEAPAAGAHFHVQHLAVAQGFLQLLLNPSASRNSDSWNI